MTNIETHDRAFFESERSFRLLIEGVADYAIYMLDPNGIITNWNIGGQRIKGYAPEEIIGQHFSKFYIEEDRLNGKPARALAAAENHGRYEEDGWRVRKDGTFFWASVVIDPIRESGKLIGFAKITRDITERREAQLKFDAMQRQLAESQKLDALGQLTGGVAHDFNNLLMIISGSTEVLKRGVGKDPKLQRALHGIEAAAKRGASLTRQLLTFARRQSVNPEQISLAERIEAVRDVLETGLSSGISLVVDIQGDVWPVTVDASEFETALVNLVINARDAMPDGGFIRISAKNVPATGSDRPGDSVEITVADSGVGIPDDIVSKIFDPFFTTKAVGKGTGLGLSQVHGFAHQAGGTITVSSEFGNGTRFTITLPRPEDSSAADGAYVGELSERGTVLLVEDNPDVAAVSTALLEELGYAVRPAIDAEKALQEVAHDIDLMISDIVMPGKMDGLDLARQVRKTHPGLPILLVTGYSEAARNVQADFPILRKPYEIHELSQALAKLPR